jgi:hypothetical protein
MKISVAAGWAQLAKLCHLEEAREKKNTDEN